MSGPRLAVFGGTTEGRILAERLEQEGFQGLLLVATEYGALLWGQEGAGIQVRAGRLEQDAMEALFLEEKIGLVIDATHPYAVRATENIRRACAACGIPLLRCLRGETGGAESNRPLSGERLVRFPDIPHAAEWLGRTQGRILLTTGSRDLAAFAGLDPERVYVRVLPTEASLETCRRLGYEGRHVIAMQGPFSEELNLALLREFSCSILVTKDGGVQGGFEEKRRAAARAGAVLAVVERPAEKGLSLEEVMEQARRWRRHETEEI